MKPVGTKRERLLDWIRNGDPYYVPVLIGPFNFGCYHAVTDSYIDHKYKTANGASHGVDISIDAVAKQAADARRAIDTFPYNISPFIDNRRMTPEDIIESADKTGLHFILHVYEPLPFHVIPFITSIRIMDSWEQGTDGKLLYTRRIETPAGNLKEVVEYARNRPVSTREFFVKNENDLKILACFIKEISDAVCSSKSVEKNLGVYMSEGIRNKKEAFKGTFPLQAHIQCPGANLISSCFMDQTTAIYMLYDFRDILEDMMERYWRITELWLKIAARNGIDIYHYAINGFEWLSPELYKRYMIPHARRINDYAYSEGKISWLHTCGKMKRIAQMGMYEKMRVCVLESLSTPPTGDIDNMPKTRADIGKEIVTRGGINVELFYQNDRASLAEQVDYVLDSLNGYKHMLGDTNPSYPAYPWSSIETVIDTVREKGRLFE